MLASLVRAVEARGFTSQSLRAWLLGMTTSSQPKDTAIVWESLIDFSLKRCACGKAGGHEEAVE